MYHGVGLTGTGLSISKNIHFESLGHDHWNQVFNGFTIEIVVVFFFSKGVIELKCVVFDVAGNSVHAKMALVNNYIGI